MNTRLLFLAWLLACLLPLATQADGQTLQTDVDGYYLLSSANDWKAFATIAEETPNVNARMTADIDLGDDQTMIGSVVSYQGVFNGQGHTLTVAYCNAEKCIAPFRYVEGATIEGLHVTGRMESYYVNVGGIAAIVRGNVTTVIRNCWSSSHLISGTGSIGNTIGGIASDNMGVLVIEDCLFDGSFAEKNRSFNAGFVPNNWNSLTIRNSLNIGSYYSGGGTFYRTDVSTSYSSVTLDNVYYKNANGGVAQGTAVTDEQLADGTVVALLQNGRAEEIWTQGTTPVLSFSDYADKQSPVLLNSVPQNGEVGVPVTGSIMLTFDEHVRASQSVAFNGKDLMPSVNGKTVVFEYFGLAYNQNYTFVLPANSVMDLAGNYVTEDITLTFTTSERPTNALLPFGQFSKKPWYAKSMQNPPDDWYQYGFDDSEWETVVGPMARDGMWYSNTRFPYAGRYWFRRHFTMNNVDASQQYVLYVSHDDDCVVWLNGTEVLRENFFHVTSDDIWKWVSTVIVDSNLLKEGDNVLAVYVHDGGGAAFIDCGLYTDADVFIEEKGELVLDLSPKRIEEGANQPVKLKLTRTGGWAQEETFMLTATTDSRVTVPTTITIPARQSAAVINLPIKDNDVLDADSIVEITATGEGYETVKAQLFIEDDDYPALTVKSSKSTVSEGETFQLTISTSEAVREPLTVTLTCENPRRFTCPMQATIPAGQKSVTVDVTAKDDDVPSETLSNAFIVSAPRYENGEVIVLLEDDDMPVLELTILPNKVQEGAGPVSVAGVLRRTGVTTNKITVRLSDDSNGGLYFGIRQFVLNKGVEEVNFNFGPIDNAQVDGNRTYAVTAAVWLSSCSCSATGESAGSVSAALEVLDDDGPALTLTSSLSTIKEGGKALLTVGRNTLVSIKQPLTVHLSSDYDDNLIYEHTVTIPAGQQSVQVEITSKKNDVSGDTHTAVFTVQSEGFASGTCYLFVTDQTLPDAMITDISVAESEVEAESMATISVTVVNGGQAVLPSQTHINIYVNGNTEVLRTLYTQEELNPGESTTITRQVKIATVPGNKRLHAVVNEERQVAELSYNNNTSLPVDVRVLSPYRITIQSDKTQYLPGDTVFLSGSVTGSLSANAEIEVFVINNGLRQPMTITTDNEGKFMTSYAPYERLIGHFAVGACYPGEGLAEELTGFDVIGLRRTTQEYITCEVLIGTPYQGVIAIENLGRIAQNNIRVELLTTNENCVAHFGVIDKIGPNEIVKLSYSLDASSSSSGSDWELLKARVISDEGATTDIIIYYYCIYPSAHLVANVDEINTTVSIGAVKEYPLTITNKGAGETGNISLALPSYITSQSVMNIPSLKQDESVTVILKINTMEGMQVNVPISGSLGVNCENANGLCVPYTIIPVSESKGKLVIDVCDEYTYYTPLAPHVANADVRVCRPVTNELICEGITDSDGLYKVELPEGYYQISVNAEKHESYQNYVLVDAGKENISIVNLSYDGGIKVSWDVVETEVEDEYQIHTTISYETNVPTPVLILDMPESIPANELRVGESLLFNAILTNKGMIAIHEAQIILPSGLETLTFENIGSGPVTLSSQQSIVFPIKVTRIAPSNNSRRDVNAAGEKKLDIPCTEAIIPIGYWNCGVDKKWYRHEGITLNLGVLCPPSDLKGDGGGDRSDLPLYGRLSGANFNPYIPNIPTIFPEIHHNIKDCDPCLQSQVLTILDCGLSTVSKYKAIKAVVSCLISTYDAMQTIIDEKSDNLKKLGAVIEASAVCGSALSSPKGGSRLSEAITSILYTLDETAGRFMQGKEMDWDYTVDMLGSLANALSKLTEFGFEGFEEIACPLKLLKPCEDGRKTTKAQSFDSKMGETMSLPLMVQNNDPSYIQEYKRSISYGVIEMLAMIGIKKEMYGDDEWYLADAEELTDFYMKFNSLLNIDGSFPISNMGELLGSKPDNLNSAQIESFIQRWNNSLSENGIDNRVNIEKAMSYFELINEVQKHVNSLGYLSVAECAEEAYDRVMDYLEKSDDNVCASVTLEIKQVMTLTRPAYRGTLTVFNGHDSAAMTDARLNLVARDANGKVATAHEFQINAESLEGFGGEVSLTSGWTLEAQQTGKATILFIPTKYAAPTEPVKYSFGGTLTYIDPFTGLEITRDLFPVTLTVNPTPDLELTYLMQRDVYGDDPLTTDKVEPMEEAEFALIINNKGYGEAKNVRMLTEQPKITENEKGLFIDFDIISSQVNGNPATLSLGQTIANDFGSIAARSQAYAQWWLRSTLLGHFTSYEVEANHVTSYGNQDLSLVDTVTIHEMVHGFTPKSNMKRGWLVNDIADADDMPDVVYFTDATQQSLYMATATTGRKSDTEYQLTMTSKTAGWNYGSVADPTNGKQKLVKIVRQSDGVEMPVDNVWQTDRTLRDGRDWLYENRLHFVGEMANGSETYILTFEPKPDVELAVEQFIGVPPEETVLTEPLNEMTVRFTKAIQPETFTADDITLHCQGERQDEKTIIITKQSNTDYLLRLDQVNQQDGYYVLTVQTAGITDSEGFNGRDGKSASWVQYLKAVKPETYFYVTTTPAGYATFYDSQIAYKLPADLKANVVSGASSEKLTYTVLNGDVVPKGVPVMLESNPHKADTYKLTSTESAAAYNGTNLLRGSDIPTMATPDSGEQIYKLAYGPSETKWSKVFGWYWGAENGGAFQIEGHKAWLAVPVTSGSRMTGYFVDGDALDVEAVMQNQNGHTDIYDLQGRKIENRQLPKGVYIWNRQKVIVK